MTGLRVKSAQLSIVSVRGKTGLGQWERRGEWTKEWFGIARESSWRDQGLGLVNRETYEKGKLP